MLSSFASVAETDPGRPTAEAGADGPVHVQPVHAPSIRQLKPQVPVAA